MKGLAKKNNKTRGQTTHKKKNNKKKTRKVKIRGGRRALPDLNDHEQDNDAYIVPNEEQPQEQLPENWVDYIPCPHDNPEYRRYSRFHPDAERYENELWQNINNTNYIPQHLRHNKDLWMDICHNSGRRRRNGGKKRKTYKKRK